MHDSVRSTIFQAIGFGVPCRRPFSGIKLLQLLSHDQVGQVTKYSGEFDLLTWIRGDDSDDWRTDRGHCLVDQGKDTADTLISVMEDSTLRKELEDLVEDANEQYVVTLDEEEVASLRGLMPLLFLKDVEAIESQMKSIDLEEITNSPAFMAKLEEEVGKEFAKVVKGYAGLRRASDKEVVHKVELEGKKVAWYWEDWMTRSDRDKAQPKNNMGMSLTEFLAMLASLPRPGFLMKNDMNWRVLFEDKTIRKRIVSSHKLRKFYRSPDLHLDLERHMGVVTAIHFISGGLTFEGDALQATNEAFDMDDIDEGWHCSVTDAGTVVVSETNPVEWIVAIEYGDVAMNKKDAELGLVRLTFVDPQASKKRWPWTLMT